MEQVILVDEQDNVTGTMGKMEAHREATLHRAFSVFIFNRENEMLLQQRSWDKYHSGGLWTNACCSHPRPGEEIMDAAERRLKEEMGIETSLHKVFHFTYKAAFDNGLTEYEFDHVLVGSYDGQIQANATEVHDFAYKNMNEIETSLQSDPAKYTAWFHIAFPKVYDWWKESRQQ